MRALLLTVVVAAAAGAGCATASAHTEVAMPELAPPPPPPRVIAVYDPPIAADPVAEPVELPAPPATEGGRRETAPPRPSTPAQPAPEPPRPVPPPSLTLTPAPGTEAQTEASIRALAAKAGRDLARVNYAALDADGRTQYDTARRFVQQAEAALKAGNLVFAGKLADKAATMAAVLVR